MSQSNNPFAALFESIPPPHQPTPLPATSNRNTTELENIFGFTLDRSKGGLVYLDDSASTFQNQPFDAEVLEHALFERLLLQNPRESINGTAKDDSVAECKALRYLFECYERLHSCKVEALQQIEAVIMQNVLTALQQPDMYEGQDLFVQLFEILKELQPAGTDFYVAIFNRFREDPGLFSCATITCMSIYVAISDAIDAFRETFTQVLKLLHKDILQASPLAFPPAVYYILNIYALHEELAGFLLDYCQPKRPNLGRDYSNTLLGTLLGVSILPKSSQDQYEFFKYPMDPVSAIS